MTAMAASPSAYVNGDNSFSDPMTARHNFQSQYDLDNPVEAVACYARYVISLSSHNSSRPARCLAVS